MILQGDEFFRFLLIYLVNSVIIATFLIITVKILIRNKNQLTIVLSNFFIFAALSLGINAIYYPLRIETYVHFLHFLTLFFVLFSQIFLVIFNLLLLNKGVRYPLKKIIWISNLIWDFHLHKTTQIEILHEFANRGYNVYLIASYSSKKNLEKIEKVNLILVPLRYVPFLSTIIYILILLFFLPIFFAYHNPDFIIIEPDAIVSSLLYTFYFLLIQPRF